MPVDITQQVATFEIGETQQFTYASTATVPATLVFNLRDFQGSIVPLASVQSGEIVSQSLTIMNSPTGLFFINRVLPDTPGIYFAQFVAWDSASRPYPTTFEIELKDTGAHSFQTYADVQDVVKNARQIFNRGNMTIRDMRAYVEAADAWIDVKLGIVAANSLPVTPVPNFLRGMSKAGAYYFYYSERYAIEREEAPPGVVDEWSRYNDLLDGVLAGSYSIPGLETSLPRAQALYVSTRDNRPIFGLRDWIDFAVDPEVIAKEEGLADD